MIGPVQVLVVGFDRPDFSGEVLGELARLRDAGIVRLVGLLLVARDVDGDLEVVDLPDDIPPALSEAVLALLAGVEGDAAAPPAAGVDPGTWSLAESVPAGAVAAVALLEHLWAGPLRAALARAGGRALDESWLAPDDLGRLAAALAGPDA